MSPWLRWRSGLDRVAAATALVPLAPIGLLASVVLRALHGSPVFIRLERVGSRGKPIAMWKVRTMRAELPGGLAGGQLLTANDDPRVTRIGRLLRRWRLDELPQLLNVIAGDMALIGPRPETPEYVDLARRSWTTVLSARPGIVGPTQLLVHRWEQAIRDGASDDVYRHHILPLKLEVDEWYVQRASPAIDLLVARELLVSFLGGRRPAALRARIARDVAALREIPD